MVLGALDFFSNLLDAVAARADEFERVTSYLSPAERASLRLVSRRLCAATSDDGLWMPDLFAKGFTAEALEMWAKSGQASVVRPAHELFGRVYQREMCCVELVRRAYSRITSRWWAEGALDLLNPFDTPAWLLFSVAGDDGTDSGVSSGGDAEGMPALTCTGPPYLQPVTGGAAGRVRLRTATGPPICRGYTWPSFSPSELVLLRLDVERADVSTDDVVLADSLNAMGMAAGGDGAEEGFTAGVDGVEGGGRGAQGGSCLAVDGIMLPGRATRLGAAGESGGGQRDANAGSDDSDSSGSSIEWELERDEPPPHPSGTAQRDPTELLDALTITIGKHVFACPPPSLAGQVRPFRVDVALVTDLRVLTADGHEVALDGSLELHSESGANIPTTLPPRRPRYVVGAASNRPSMLTFFPWERRAREAHAICGRRALAEFDDAAVGGVGQGDGEGIGSRRTALRWCRQAEDPDLVRLERPATSELRMTLLRSTRVVASAVT
jgi:hypothetical protein